MSKKEKVAYRKGQADMFKMLLGSMAIAVTFAVMFGQAFMF